MTLSVIVPTYLMSEAIRNQWHTYRARMEAVATVPTEWLPVDNGSQYPPDHAVTYWPENRGVAPAWNEGVRHATGDLLAFVTCTTQVEPGWDANLCAVAQSGRVIAMPYTNGQKGMEGIGVTGWCWVIRRDLWDEVGPFDETFVPVQYEDTDFFMRAHNVGIEMVNVPTAQVTRTRRRGTWANGGFDQKAYAIHMANRWRFFWKHGVDVNDIPPFWKTPLRDVTP